MKIKKGKRKLVRFYTKAKEKKKHFTKLQTKTLGYTTHLDLYSYIYKDVGIYP